MWPCSAPCFVSVSTHTHLSCPSSLQPAPLQQQPRRPRQQLAQRQAVVASAAAGSAPVVAAAAAEPAGGSNALKVTTYVFLW